MTSHVCHLTQNSSMCHIYISIVSYYNSIVIFFLIIKFIWEIIGFVKNVFHMYACLVFVCVFTYVGVTDVCVGAGVFLDFSSYSMEAGSLTEPGALHFGYPACSRSSVSTPRAVGLHLSRFAH